MRKKHMICGNVLTLAATLSLAMAAPRAAVGEIVITTSDNYTFAPAANNLIAGMDEPVVVNGSSTHGGPVSKLTDGDATAGQANTYTIGNNAVLTYTLSHYGEAYAVSGVNIYSGWQDAGRKNITISSLAYSTPEAPDVFTAIPGTAVDYVPGTFNGLAQYTADDGIMAENVHSFRVNFGTQQSTYVGYREIEIIGTADVVIWNTGATEAAYNSAVLQGFVFNAVSGDADVFVAWGTADDPAAWEAADRHVLQETPGIGVLNVPVSGLASSTAYFFAFGIDTGDGVEWSNVSGFATLPAEPAVQTGAATEVVVSSAVVSGTLLNEGMPPTKVYAFYGTDPATWGAPADLGAFETGDPFAKVLDNLLPNTVYYYSFMASNDIATAWGATNSFCTLGAPALANAVVDRVVDISARVTATLSECVDARVRFVWWQTSDPATTYTNDLGVVGAGVVTSQLSGLSVSTPYDVQIHAENQNGSFSTPVASFSTIATVTSFTSAQNGNWSDAGTWTPSAVPRAGADVTIASGHTVVVDVETDEVRDVQITGILSFDGWDSLLRARDVVLAGTVKHEQNTATTTNSLGVWEPNARVNIECANFTMNAGSRIDVNYMGYQSPPLKTNGYGPGSGVYVSLAAQGYPIYGHGAGHGGAGGGIYFAGDDFSKTYGDATAPMHPGSSGAVGDTAGHSRGGAGGGVVRIVATGDVTLGGNGISANALATNYHTGGGAGGSVYIQCRTLLGSGAIVATGTGGWCGGGGGRIAVIYDTAAQSQVPLPAITFNTAGGKGEGNWLMYGPYDGDVGTLYFPDSQFLTRNDGTISHSGQWLAPVPDVIERETLTFNNAWLRFPEGVSFAVANDVIVKGTDNRLHKLELDGGQLSIGGTVTLDKAALRLRRDALQEAVVLRATDLFVTNAAALYVHSNEVESFGDVGASVEISGDMVVASTSWVYPFAHPTNGGCISFKTHVLEVTEGAGFDANYNGFAGGDYWADGFGPGKGSFAGGNNIFSGGGHGGLGGGSVHPYGITNDVAIAPMFPGSGGSGGSRNDMTLRSFGGRGGGAYRILGNTVRLDGSLLANGDPGKAGWNSGGGAGGSIFVKCRIFEGGETGLLSANGGGAPGNQGGAGGGGRIAVWYNVLPDALDREDEENQFKSGMSSDSIDTFLGTFSVDNGVDGIPGTSTVQRAQPGTIMLVNVPPRATLLLVR